MDNAIWIFGYGSLIWRPDFDFIDRAPTRVSGWKRRFWQGSHDHRGVPDAPGRVVTLIPEPAEHCTGMAYLIDTDTARDTFELLDHREKNGYDRFDVTLEFSDRPQQQGVVYIAPLDNFAYLGPAPLSDMAQQIAFSTGPSGRNRDYLFELEAALQELDVEDAHVTTLANEVRRVIAAAQRSASL